MPLEDNDFGLKGVGGGGIIAGGLDDDSVTVALTEGEGIPGAADA